MGSVVIVAEAPAEGAMLMPVRNRATISFISGPEDPPNAPPPSGLMGTVTFNVFRNLVPEVPREPDCSGEPLFSSGPHDVIVESPDRPVKVISDEFTPLEKGEYYWGIEYRSSGRIETLVFQPSSMSLCGGPDQVMVVQVASAFITTRPTVACRLGQFIIDSLWIRGAVSEPFPTGTVTFELFGPDQPDCSGPRLMTSFAEIRPPEGEPNARSKIFRPSRPGTYRWRFQYSGDDHYIGGLSACGGPEGTSVVFEHKPDENVAVAEFGVPERHRQEATKRGRVIYADVVDLLPLPGEVTEE